METSSPAIAGHAHRSHGMHLTARTGLFLTVLAHSLAMLLVMGLVASIVNSWFSLAILRPK